MDESVTEFALAKRILFFTSVGTVGGLACEACCSMRRGWKPCFSAYVGRCLLQPRQAEKAGSHSTLKEPNFSQIVPLRCLLHPQAR